MGGYLIKDYLMPQLHNKHHNTAGPDAVYIGRGSSYGNPFVIGVHGDRDAVCDQYEQLVLSEPDRVVYYKEHLKGKDLVCFCKPARCHGDFLLNLVNEE